MTMYQMTMQKQCDYVRGAACSHEPTENYHPNLQLSAALWSFQHPDQLSLS